MLVLCEILNSCHLSTFISAIPWLNSRGSFRVRKSKRGNELKLVTASLSESKYLNNPSTWCQADTSTLKTMCSSKGVCRWVFSGMEQSWRLVRRSEMFGCRIWHLLTLFRGIDAASSQVLDRACVSEPPGMTQEYTCTWVHFLDSTFVSHFLQTSLFYCNWYFVCLRHAASFIFLPFLSTLKHFPNMLLKISAVSLPKNYHYC